MQTEEQTVQLKRKKRKKNKGALVYFYLFVIVFIAALSGLSYIVKSYSPDVDVSIGNQESLTLSESELDVEVKSVDERLKWIQMEDEMPSVAIREAKESTEKSIKEKTKNVDVIVSDDVVKKVIELPTNDEPIFKRDEIIPKPELSEIVTLPKEQSSVEQSVSVVPQPLPQVSDFRNTVKLPVIPAPIPTLTKVYLGSFSTVDEAMSMQQKVSTDIPESMPFIKSQNGAYIVQLGSFSNKEIADAFVLKLKEKGYNPKTINQN